MLNLVGSNVCVWWRIPHNYFWLSKARIQPRGCQNAHHDASREKKKTRADITSAEDGEIIRGKWGKWDEMEAKELWLYSPYLIK